MRRTCKLLARFYPRDWRSRYQKEFDQILEDSDPSLKDAALIVSHAAALRLEKAWESTFGPVLILSALANVIGLANAWVAPASGYALWQSTGKAVLLALALMLLSGICGVQAGRRTGAIPAGAAAGLTLTLLGNVLPVTLLYVICGRMESSAPLSTQAHWMESKEWFQHWGRSLLILTPVTLAGGCILGACGAAGYKIWRAVSNWSSQWRA